MPRVKIEYIVSFSSEDPEHPARSLLAAEAGAGRWLCLPPSARGSVLLQLARAVQISAIHIGGYNAAFVEVLVGRSETPEEQFDVLVPSSSLMDAADSRRGVRPERVRSFSGEQLARAAREPHDRVRVVCSQPYDKRAKYGLSFVHIYEPEGGEPAGTRALAAPAFRADSSDEEDFRPGELFAAQRGCASARPLSALPATAKATGAPAPVPPVPARTATPAVAPPATAPPPRAVPVAREEKPGARRSVAPESAPRDRGRRTTSRETSEGGQGRARPLAGVVFALSGYQNPRRAALRDTALALGAAYRRDVGPDCTHLVCAFPNTPKLRALRAAGDAVRAVTADWLEDCARKRRRLPWRQYAVEPHLRGAGGDSDAGDESGGDGDAGGDDDDTDDEIARVAARRPPSAGRPEEPAERDESGADSDATLPASAGPPPAPLRPALPALLRGLVLALAGVPPPRRALLRRYVLAYGGRVAEEEAPPSEPHFRLVDGPDAPSRPLGGAPVRAAWLWSCHRLQRRCSPAPYELP